MTSLAPVEVRPIAPAKRQGGAVPDLGRHLDLDRAIATAASGIGGCSFWPEPLEDGLTRCQAVERVEAHAEWVRATLAQQAPVVAVEQCSEMLRAALRAPPDRKVVVAAVGLLVGSRARQPDNPQVFIRALEHDLVDLGFSPTVVVVALQRIRRESTFLPEICEVIAACEHERSRLQALSERVERAARYRRGLEAAQAEIPQLMRRAEIMPEEWHARPERIA